MKVLHSRGDETSEPSEETREALRQEAQTAGALNQRGLKPGRLAKAERQTEQNSENKQDAMI